MRTITVAELHEEMKAQGVAPHREDIAFKCPMCGTVQSIRSLVAAGVPAEHVERYVGFSCEGRWRDSGPAKNGRPAKAGTRGCDWTLGGLFRLHKLEVITKDGMRHPSFELAAPDEAKALAASLPKDDLDTASARAA